MCKSEFVSVLLNEYKCILFILNRLKLQVRNIRDPPSIADPNSLPIFLGSSEVVSPQRLLNGCSPDTAPDNSFSDISGILQVQLLVTS